MALTKIQTGSLDDGVIEVVNLSNTALTALTAGSSNTAQ
jgi:hypothetical protein